MSLRRGRNVRTGWKGRVRGRRHRPLCICLSRNRCCRCPSIVKKSLLWISCALLLLLLVVLVSELIGCNSGQRRRTAD